jgi:hypothetical protein
MKRERERERVCVQNHHQSIFTTTYSTEMKRDLDQIVREKVFTEEDREGDGRCEGFPF